MQAQCKPRTSDAAPADVGSACEPCRPVPPPSSFGPAAAPDSGSGVAVGAWPSSCSGASCSGLSAAAAGGGPEGKVEAASREVWPSFALAPEAVSGGK